MENELAYQHILRPLAMAPCAEELSVEESTTCANTVEAFIVLYERYHQPLAVFLERLGGCDVEDMLQETFLHAWKAWSSTRVVYPQAWLYRIARNLVYDEWARQKMDCQQLDEENCCDTNYYTADPCILYLAAELRATIYAIMMQLDPLQRQALWLRVQGLSYQHIEERIGLKGQISCVKMRVRRAREHFRAHYLDAQGQ